MLAIRRGAKEGILSFEIELDSQKPLAWLRSRVVRAPGEWVAHLEQAVEDSYDRLLNPSIQTEVRLELKDRSDEEAIKVFRENLENLLLSPPAGMLTVLALDPGIRTGCKIAVVDDTGKFLENSVIYPFEPKNDLAGSVKTLASLIARHNVQAIAIGNGTASRESARLCAGLSPPGEPHQDLQRDGKRVGRIRLFRVRDRAPGVSRPRPDHSRARFRLRAVFRIRSRNWSRSIRNRSASANISTTSTSGGSSKVWKRPSNRASIAWVSISTPLRGRCSRYVAGINERTALKIVEYRNTNGKFRSRVQLTAVPGFGPKTFEQAAGFLRIRGGDNPLDITAVHPESYGVVARIAQSLGVTVNELIARPDLVESVKLEGFATEARRHVHARRHSRRVTQARPRPSRQVRGAPNGATTSRRFPT